MAVSDWDGLHEYETQYFGFLPKGFTDVVYNLILENWVEIVAKDVLSAFPLSDIDGETKLRLKMEFVNMICKNNVLNSLMNKLEAYTLNYVFRIPDQVTLPENRLSLEAVKGWSMKAAIKRIRKLEHAVIKLRLANELLDDEIRDNKKAVQLVQALQHAIGDY